MYEFSAYMDDDGVLLLNMSVGLFNWLTEWLSVCLL